MCTSLVSQLIYLIWSCPFISNFQNLDMSARCLYILSICIKHIYVELTTLINDDLNLSHIMQTTYF